jgi:hypothetical protein
VLEEEDIKARCYIWLKSQVRVTAREFMRWLNSEITQEEAVVKIMGEGRQICVDTARLWLHKLNCKYCPKQKSYYTDNHEKYVEYRKYFLQRCSENSLRRPVWIHIKADTADDSQLKLTDGALAAAHRFTAHPEQWWIHQANGADWLELHVDYFQNLDRKTLGQYCGHWIVRFPEGKTKLYAFGHDECCFHAYSTWNYEWAVDGTRKLHKKGQGSCGHVSAVVCEHRGIGFPLRASEWNNINKYRQEKCTPAIPALPSAKPGIVKMRPGNSKEGWWGYDDFERQVGDINDAFDVCYRNAGGYIATLYPCAGDWRV